MVKSIIRPAIALGAILLAAWQCKLLLAQLGDPNASVDIDTALVEQGPFVVGISREGTLGSSNIDAVRGPNIEATLTWVAEDGKRVKKGDPVAKLDTSQYRFEVDSARLQYQNQAAQVDQAKRNTTRDYESARMDVDRTLRSLDVLSRSLGTETQQGQAQVGYDTWSLRFAETDYDKQYRLGEAKIVPKTEVEQSQRNVRSKEYALNKSEKDVSYLDAQHTVKKSQASSDIDTAKFSADLSNRRIGEAVKSAEERTRLSKRDLQEKEENLAQGELKSPRDGVVVLGSTWDENGRRTLREGDRCWPHMKIADITELGSLQVSGRVDESSANRLRAGQEARITVKGVAKREFKGKVQSIGAVARQLMFWEDVNADTNTRFFDVTVSVLSADPTVVKPGMKTKVRFVSELIKDAVYVPVSAVFDRPPRGEFVYVQHGGRFEERKVKTGKRNDEAVVISEGLRKGERVALSDPTKVEAE
jgi:RND family efflux transporter MFP subunit